jgi:D-erythronate 2-dehydrogenase
MPDWRIAITGAAGFLGATLAQRLLAADELTIGGTSGRLTELVLLDLVAPTVEDPRCRVLTGDLLDIVGDLGPVDAVFHLAGVMSGAAEADFDLGYRANLDALRAVLDTVRALPTPPVLVYTSSLAVLGADPAIGPLGLIDDDTLPRPQSSYGVQKFIGEQLVADYTRKGFVRGRSVRLMTVAVRPGRPSAAASSFASGMVREPLAGQRSNCPVPLDTELALASPGSTLAGILRAVEVDDATWGSRTAMNLPALTTTPAQMLAALQRSAGERITDLIDHEPDPAALAIVGSWPARFRTPRAAALGLTADESFDAIIEQYRAGEGFVREGE